MTNINILAQKAVLSHLRIARWGGRMHDKAVSNEVLEAKRATKGSGLFTKALIDQKAFRGMNEVHHLARSYHNSRTQPWFDDGPRILPTALYMEYIREMTKFRDRFDEAVSEFIKEYPRNIEQAKRNLGSLFDASLYPPVEEMRAKHAMEFLITNCPDTSDFRCDLPPEVLADIKRDMESRITDQIDVTVKATYERIAEVIGKMAERLKEYSPADKKSGKKASGTFRDSLVENVVELTNLLPSFNLKGDQNLSKLIAKIDKGLCHVTADALREDALVRSEVAKAADDILRDVSAFIK